MIEIQDRWIDDHIITEEELSKAKILGEGHIKSWDVSDEDDCEIVLSGEDEDSLYGLGQLIFVPFLT